MRKDYDKLAHYQVVKEFRDTSKTRRSIFYVVLIVNTVVSSWGLKYYPAFASVWLGIHLGVFAYSWYAIFDCLGMFDAAYQSFCSYKLLPEAHRLRKDYPELRTWIPKRKVFKHAKDLQALEREFLDYLHREISIIERKAKYTRWANDNERIWLKFKDQTLEYYRCGDGLIEQIRTVWDSLPLNPERRKKYVAKVDRTLAYKAYESQLVKPNTGQEHEPPTILPISMEDIRLSSLEQQASLCENPESQNLYQLGRAETKKAAKIRLYKQAIRQDRAAEEVPVISPDVSRVQAPAASRIFDLAELIKEQLPIGSVPHHVDACLAKHIVVAISSPTSTFRFWYVPARLKRKIAVRYQVESGKNLDPRGFEATLAWLTKIGVVNTEVAYKETVYTIPRNAREAKTEQARHIIQAANSLKEELKRGRVWA